jgi:alpha-1,3-fucosyltransferase
MISNCYSQNNREDYIQRLSSIIPVTRIGHCSWNKCQKTQYECLNELAETHPFYLAFENSLCQDYVTEKYALVITNSRMIPVVFSKNSNLYIPNSFIDANSFSSPEDLGQFLIQLVKNTTAYESYFKWKTEYELIVPDENDYLCELCKNLNNPKEPDKIYSSMKTWLYDDAKCQRWISKLNSTIDISVDETMDYKDSWF